MDLRKEKLAIGLRKNESHLGYGEFCVTKVRGEVEVEVYEIHIKNNVLLHIRNTVYVEEIATQ